MVDATDSTFEDVVLKRSFEVPVVVDLWAPWCGPCTTLGPIVERVVAATDGAVELAKVDVDENPAVSASFRVQSIPAVFAVRDGAVVDQFIGAQPEAVVQAFVDRLAPARSEADVLADEGAASGDEAALRRALDLRPDHPVAIAALAGLLIGRGEAEEAVALLGRIPETPEIRRLLAEARLAERGDVPTTDVATLLDGLLERVKGDPDARQEFLDLLETLGPDDPRTLDYRKALASRLF
ncbi:MAG: tetratricopeptide repeat protein [Acidimicrobiales bacterium]|jgi:putative thioredoxin